MTTTSENHTPTGLTSSEPFVSGHGRAQVVVFLFLLIIAVGVFSIFSNLLQVNLLAGASEGVEVSQEAAESNDMRQGAVWLVHLAVRVALIIAFLMWLYRAAGNMAALGNPKTRIEYTPGWAVGWFFIPFANLVMPYKAVSEVWVKSEPPVREGDGHAFSPRPSTSLVLAWWLTWLVSNFIGRFASSFWKRTETVEALQGMTWAAILSDVLSIAAAVLAIFVVQSIDRRQEERSRHVAYVRNLPPPPPIYRPQPRPSESHESETHHPPPLSQS